MPVKPSESEDEYFARQEFERRKAALAEAPQREEAEARRRVLEIAKQRCPKCGAKLVTVMFRGVEVDKCTECQGVWLDCGELERVAASDEGGFLGGLRRAFGSSGG